MVMTEEQLLASAVRCIRLAEVCLDSTVAKKLRALAQDYRRLAEQPPGRPMACVYDLEDAATEAAWDTPVVIAPRTAKAHN
jgi:hypothetical protein